MGITDRIYKQHQKDAAHAAKNRGRVLPSELSGPLKWDARPLSAQFKKRIKRDKKGTKHQFYDPMLRMFSNVVNRFAD